MARAAQQVMDEMLPGGSASQPCPWALVMNRADYPQQQSSSGANAHSVYAKSTFHSVCSHRWEIGHRGNTLLSNSSWHLLPSCSSGDNWRTRHSFPKLFTFGTFPFLHFWSLDFLAVFYPLGHRTCKVHGNSTNRRQAAARHQGPFRGA